MKTPGFFHRVSPRELIVFLIWWLAVVLLTGHIGGIPLDRVDVGGMYRIKLKGSGNTQTISYGLYWTWAILAYGLAPYMVYILCKYGRYLRRHTGR